MHLIKLDNIIEEYIKINDYGFDLKYTLVEDGNKSYESDHKFYNAANIVTHIRHNIDVILERLWRLKDFYVLLYCMETEKDKFLVSEKISNQKELIYIKLESTIKYIREKNLTDYRVIDFERDVKVLIENTNTFLEEL